MKFRIPSIILGILLLAISFCFGHGDREVAEDIAEKTAEIAEISTKPSIVALANAMKSFRASLSSELLDAASFPLGHKESYSWTNTPPGRNSDRGGIRFGELSVDQLTLFYYVLDAFLSDDGYTKVSLITKDVETYLNKIRPGMWDPNRYHIALFGNPETDGSWGFQLDGHHLALNFLVHGDEVSIVPAFIGTEPATVNGTVVLDGERTNAFALMHSFNASQREKAIQTGRRRLQVGPGRSTDTFLNYDYSDFVGVGLKASEMNDTQKQNLRNLIKTYVYNLETEFADVWMTDVDAGLDDTYFVWIGGTTINDPIYYRVFNPAVWIEFNNEGGVGTRRGRGGRDGRDGGSRGDGLDHIHSITRSPNGKDYGIFALNHGPKTLLEHYALEDHHKTSDKLFDYSIANLKNIENRETH
ncbi:DUF3500 domain-containing protein [Candidatus Poribacteria bacterium]|nr:DUF3500 domain-containing protein [Candidatus Poribacteria bacterium]MXY28574.1 DUF3500 domain-containing protein [Candidatus Poribacteria bacterium]MYK17110.1 DUF3500 domain-containing protein [Candidatus Poribacteria bacterium]